MDFISSFGFFFLAAVVPGIAIGSLVSILMLEKRVNSLRKIVQSQSKAIEILRQRSVLPPNFSGQQLSEMMEQYIHYRNTGGTLDLLSYLLAQDDKQMFP